MTFITSSIDVTVETTTVTSENQINEATFEVNTDNEGTTIAELNISNQISELVELTHEVHSDTMNYVVETTGAVNGLSAYELWILQDNAGTVEDFLDSLIGPGVPAGGTAGQILSKIDGTETIHTGSRLLSVECRLSTPEPAMYYQQLTTMLLQT